MGYHPRPIIITILLHEDCLLPLLQPSAAARRREEQEEKRGDPSWLSPCPRGTEAFSEDSVFCNTEVLWMGVKESIMAPPVAVTLPDPFLMWDSQRLSWTVE